MLYHLYEMQHAALAPARLVINEFRRTLHNPFNPWSRTNFARIWLASLDLFEHVTRRYGKPTFDLNETLVDGNSVGVEDKVVYEKPFCNLVYFDRDLTAARKDADPRVLIVAPMSGHYATLLRGTVEAMLPDHEVYITDWIDARDVPVWEGSFDLDDYVDYVIDLIHFLGPNTHVIAVCQPSVPVLAAISIMGADCDAATPASMTLMGGPIDTRVNPTEVNLYAKSRPIHWFERNVISSVPAPNLGMMRRVYPGFLQLAGFMSMNISNHMDAHKRMFLHLVEGDGESAQATRDFYEEYLAVMDMTAEFYLQTVKTVFQDHLLPLGAWVSRGRRVNPGAIEATALLTVEGERDDISGVGQTAAAHDLCTALPDEMRSHYLAPGVGHYGIFNGRRWREITAPRVKEFIRQHDRRLAKPSPGETENVVALRG